MELIGLLLISSAILFFVLLILLIVSIAMTSSNLPKRRPVREDLRKIKAQIEDKAYI